MKEKILYLYWLVPVLTFLPQLLMSLNSFNQLRFEEFIESIQAVYWFDQRQIINGLHVNVGWYAFLLSVYKLFGFSLYTGKITNLVASFLSTFCLFYLLKKFFDAKIASLILVTIVLSPTLLFINTLSLHWAMTYHLMIIILLLLYVLDFSKRRQSLILTGVIFLLIMITWFFYQAVVFYIPSLVIFYWLKYRSHLRGEGKVASGAHLGGVAAMAFLLPLLMLFIWVDNKQMLILDPETGTGLFRGGGRFEFSDQVFTQAWTDFISDFFVRGVSHHFEVAQAEFSLIFPIISLLFMVYCIWKIFKQVQAARKLILLALLVMVFDIVIFSTTADLGLPGMKRLTPMLFSIYFLWVIVWYYLSPHSSLRASAKQSRKEIAASLVSLAPRNDGLKKNLAYLVLSLLAIHHLVVYPINYIHIKDPSPFKVTDWDVDESIRLVQREDLLLDCRSIVAQLGQCSYDFIYPAVAGLCKWNNLNCHQILGYDVKDNKFVPLSLDLWQNKFFER